MKSNPTKNIVSKLIHIGEELEYLTRPESKAAFQEKLDGLIAALTRLRSGLTNPSLAARAADIERPLEQVIGFLEFAKSEDILKTLLAPTGKSAPPKAKREPVQIASSLTNEQIRALLEKDLSKAELKAVAAQRAISVGKSTNDEIKRDILKNLQRQEGYERLAS